MALLRQAKVSGRLVVLVQALTTPTLAAADAAPGSFVEGTSVPAAIQVGQGMPCSVLPTGGENATNRARSCQRSWRVGTHEDRQQEVSTSSAVRHA